MSTRANSRLFKQVLDFIHNLSTMANTGLGVPVKLLHESLGHIITVELKTGQLYRGKLAEGMSILPFHSNRY